jgi:hypothetical protein
MRSHFANSLVDPGHPVGRAGPLRMYRQFVLSYPKVPVTVSKSPYPLSQSLLFGSPPLSRWTTRSASIDFMEHAPFQMHNPMSPIMDSRPEKVENGVLVLQVLLLLPAIDWIDRSTQKKLAPTGRSRASEGVRPLGP